MFFHQSVNGDPRSFMYYKGDIYINGTEITFSDDFIKNTLVDGKKIWKYARFDHQETNVYGELVYFFSPCKFDWLSLNKMGLNPNVMRDYSPYVRVNAFNIESAIEEITHGIKLERKQTEAVLDAIATPKSDFEYPGLVILWIAYIAVLLGSLIFNQFYIIWAIATWLFLKWRKELRNS